LGNYQMVELLIGLDADINLQYRTVSDTVSIPIHGSSPLRWAIQKKHTDIVELLLKHVDEPKIAILDLYMSPLHLAVVKGDTKLVQLLLNKGFDPSELASFEPTSYGTALEIAAYKGHTEICLLLLKHGMEVNTKAKDQRSPLQYAVSQDRLETAEALIKAGADVNYMSHSYTLIHRAIYSASAEMVRLLIANGSKLDLTQTLLLDASKHQDLSIIKVMVEAGFDVNACDPYGNSPLHDIVASKNKTDKLDKVKYIISAGADVNLQNNKGFSALHMAVEQNETAVVEYLLRHSADINLTFEHNFKLGGKANALALVKSYEVFQLLKDSKNYNDLPSERSIQLQK